MSIGDDTAELFARALVGNEKLRILHLIGEEEEESITAAGWSALSKVLCDTSSVNATYSSNDTIEELWEQPDPEDYRCGILSEYELNRIHPQHAAICKKHRSIHYDGVNRLEYQYTVFVSFSTCSWI